MNKITEMKLREASNRKNSERMMEPESLITDDSNLVRESNRDVKLQRSVENVPNSMYKETEEEDKERKETPLRMLWKRHGKVLKAKKLEKRKDSYDPYRSPSQQEVI